MADTPEFLAGRLRSEGEKAAAFLSSLTAGQWQQLVYTEGAPWTVQQVLMHFLATEQSIYRLVEDVAAGGPGAPEGFDIDAYNARKVAELADTPVEELLRQFGQQRARMTALVAGLEPGKLEQRGRHPFLGVAPLSDIIRLVYRHNQIHLRDVKRALSL